jgi:spore germination cell wall hydrolase CwlJ-like protein
MGDSGFLSMRGGLFVLALLALFGPAYADEAGDKSAKADESIAGAAQSGIALAALEVAAQSDGPFHYTTYSERELRCLAEGMYFEARGEPLRGQLAVGRVILNRVQSDAYPDTICDVVYQNEHRHNRCQFSFACDGKPDKITEREVWYQIRGYAAWLLANDPRGESEYQVLASLETATHYHADYVTPRWAKFLKLTVHIGRHLFYADPSA